MNVQARNVRSRKPRTAVLIVCEGAKTEPSYFRGLKRALGLSSVDVQGLGMNTRSLVEEAIRRKQAIDGLDECWCVFDRDSFPAATFNAALERARQAGIHVAYSNEAFELWYILHFDFMQSALSRRLYSTKLEERLGRPYQKNDETMYETLVSRQDTAIKYAKKLLESYSPSSPEANNPSTTVHQLVERLHALAAEQKPAPPPESAS